MNCRRYRKSLVSDVGADRGERDRHRSACRACRLFAARYEAARDLLAVPAAKERDRQPGSGFAAGVIAALPERPHPMAWAAVRLLPATTALALTLLGWCWLATPAPDELWTRAGEDEVLAWVLGENGDDV